MIQRKLHTPDFSPQLRKGDNTNVPFDYSGSLKVQVPNAFSKEVHIVRKDSFGLIEYVSTSKFKYTLNRIYRYYLKSYSFLC